MSITVQIFYTGENGSAQDFAREMCQSGVVDAIRKEEGNEKYEYFLSMEDPETILLIDQWKDQKALDFHHASPMMDKISALREKHHLHMKAERYVEDAAGFTKEDQKFILP